MTQGQRRRSTNALVRLESQLKAGNKTEKKTLDKKVALTAGNVKRIEKEITTLTKKMM